MNTEVEEISAMAEAMMEPGEEVAVTRVKASRPMNIHRRDRKTCVEKDAWRRDAQKSLVGALRAVRNRTLDREELASVCRHVADELENGVVPDE